MGKNIGHATDNVFLTHFEIPKDEIIEVIRLSAGHDAPVVAWFQTRPACSAERIQSWNTLAPNLGKAGFPVHRGFLFLLKTFYGGTASDPRVDSAFTAITYDEGYLDEIASP
jgi:hypothetical protein